MTDRSSFYFYLLFLYDKITGKKVEQRAADQADELELKMRFGYDTAHRYEKQGG